MRRAAIAVLIVTAAFCANATANIPVGNPIGTISSSAIPLHSTIYEGGWDLLNGTAWPPELRYGPATYPQSAYPCNKGTVSLAGHHLTNSHPFRYIRELSVGDPIKLTTAHGSCTYHVVSVFTTTDDNTAVLIWGSKDGHQLVLTSCDQIYDSEGKVVKLLRTIVDAAEGNPQAREQL